MIDQIQDVIPYIMTAALIIVGAVLAYLILTTGPSSQPFPTTSTTSSTSFFNTEAPVPAAMTLTTGHSAQSSLRAQVSLDGARGCQTNESEVGMAQTSPFGRTVCYA